MVTPVILVSIIPLHKIDPKQEPSMFGCSYLKVNIVLECLLGGRLRISEAQKRLCLLMGCGCWPL